MFNKCHVKSERSSVDACIGGYKIEDITEAEAIKKLVTIYKRK